MNHNDKIYLYAKGLYKAKYQLLINKRESTGLKHLNYSKGFIKYSNDMDDIYKNIEEYNPNIFSQYLTGKDIMPSDERQVIEQACIFSS